MNSSFWGMFFIIVGLFGVAWIVFFGGTITDNERNYYSLKEITQAAMFDSVDQQVKYQGIGYDGVTKQTSPYMNCETGDLQEFRINREQFVESFARRFADSTVYHENDYDIIIHDISECPALVNVEIRFKSNRAFINWAMPDDGANQDKSMTVPNKIVGILESKDAFENDIGYNKWDTKKKGKFNKGGVPA